MTDQIEMLCTPAEGRLATGARRGHGSAEIMNANKNRRWSRQLRAWYIPRSRDQLAKTALIEVATAALEKREYAMPVRLDLAGVRGQHGVDADKGDHDDQSHDPYD